MAGLFALWSAFQTDIFSGAAAASPSLWFPGFSAYMKEKSLGCETVYLSLGTREEKTRNPVMRTVGDCARYCFTWMKEQGINCTLEWNPGNHFKEPGLRTAKAFAWVMNHMRETPAHAAEKRNMKKPEKFCWQEGECCGILLKLSLRGVAVERKSGLKRMKKVLDKRISVWYNK